MIDRRESAGVAAQKQRAQLREILIRARRLAEYLGPLQAREGHRVHFRPGPTGVDMVSLLPERPLQGRRAIRNLSAFVPEFEREFQRWCVEGPAERTNVEKRLSAWLIRESYRAGRRMTPLEDCSARAGYAEVLRFVTDDLPMPYEGRRLASDLLAVREETAGVTRAVVLEVARRREVGLVRAESFAHLVDEHAELFSELFGVLLGATVRLTPPAVRAVLWPVREGAGLEDPDPAASSLAERGIVLFLYATAEEGFALARPAEA